MGNQKRHVATPYDTYGGLTIISTTYISELVQHNKYPTWREGPTYITNYISELFQHNKYSTTSISELVQHNNYQQPTFT